MAIQEHQSIFRRDRLLAMGTAGESSSFSKATQNTLRHEDDKQHSDPLWPVALTAQPALFPS